MEVEKALSNRFCVAFVVDSTAWRSILLGKGFEEQPERV